MLCRNIMEQIETTYPKQSALEWDNVGLLVGRTDKEVKCIYVTLDVTDEAIDDAIAKRADLILSHHPILFSPLRQLTNEHFIGKRIIQLLQHDICCYAMHTNYDILRMADLAGKILELQSTEVLEDTGIGIVGTLKEEITLSECCELVKACFDLPGVKVFGKGDKKIKKVAICPGSGKHMTELAIAKQADVFITAEIDHHEGIDSVAQGIAVVDAGHYGLEHIFIEDMATYLKENLEGIRVEVAKISHPFLFV